MTHSYERFAQIFNENIYRRSRSRKGISDTSTSKQKKPLLLSGDALREQVAENTKNLIDFVWDIGGKDCRGPEEIRYVMESMYDIINYKLQPPDAYQEEIARLEGQAEALRLLTDLPYRINERYRVWDVSYTNIRARPVALEVWMDSLYAQIFEYGRMATEGHISQAELLAFADVMIDGEIHPWLDGCGRSATATVMWLSLLKQDYALPLFHPDRDEHYRSIRDLSEHTQYFQYCLTRKK